MVISVVSKTPITDPVLTSKKTRYGRLLLYVLAAAFAYGCLHLLSHDLGQLPTVQWSRLAGVITVCGALSLLNYALRIWRWQIFLSRLGHGFTFVRSTLYYVAGFAFTLSPGKVGELARIRYYQAHGVPVKTVTAAFFIERLLDLLAVLAMAFLFFFQLFAGEHYQFLIGITAAVLLGVVALLVCLPWGAWEQHPTMLRYPVLSKVTETLVQSKALLEPTILFMAALLSLLAWGAEGIGLGVLLQPFDSAEIGWVAAASIYALAVLAGAVSFLPGGLGGTEVVMAALLHQYGLNVGEAMLVTLLCRLLTLWLAVLLGWLAIFILRMKRYAPL